MHNADFHCVSHTSFNKFQKAMASNEDLHTANLIFQRKNNIVVFFYLFILPAPYVDIVISTYRGPKKHI